MLPSTDNALVKSLKILSKSGEKGKHHQHYELRSQKERNLFVKTANMHFCERKMTSKTVRNNA